MNINGTCISSISDEHGSIYVYQTDTSRILSFDGEIQQSRMRLDDINGLAHSYTQAMMTGLLFIREPGTATITGLGAGSMVKNLLSSFAGVAVHAVEYREAVANTAKKYFYLPESERLHVHIDDALKYMKQGPVRSDIIFSDLYNTSGMEPRQVQVSYLRNCKNALNEDGVLVLNIWRKALKSHGRLEKLLSVEFENRLLHFEIETGNNIVLAFKNAIPVLKRKTFLEQARQLQQQMGIPLERYARLLLSTQRNKFIPG